MQPTVWHDPPLSEKVERLARQESLILDVTESLWKSLKSKSVTQAELARRLGRSRSFVSRMLDGRRNLTLRTIADVSYALSLEPSFLLQPAHQEAAAAIHPPITPVLLTNLDRHIMAKPLPMDGGRAPPTQNLGHAGECRLG